MRKSAPYTVCVSTAHWLQHHSVWVYLPNVHRVGELSTVAIDGGLVIVLVELISLHVGQPSRLVVRLQAARHVAVAGPRVYRTAYRTSLHASVVSIGGATQAVVSFPCILDWIQRRWTL